mmetsp:Transcript_60810/g.170430  ORF Transcript_60810/g.170430 Transcript_60810/m.170430 type:complete len:211 (-) Transcript_60810:769-1401(-)
MAVLANIFRDCCELERWAEDAEELDVLGAIEDDYDPRKPEYIVEATPEEMAEREASLLEAQIEALAGHLAKRPRGGDARRFKAIAHYFVVLRAMRRRLRVLRAGAPPRAAAVRMREAPSSWADRSGPKCLPREDSRASDVETVSRRCSSRLLSDDTLTSTTCYSTDSWDEERSELSDLDVRGTSILTADGVWAAPVADRAMGSHGAWEPL